MSKKIKITIISLIVLGLWLWMPNVVKAAYVSVSPSKSTASAGDNVNITVSSDCTGRVDLSVNGNATLSTDKVWLEGKSETVTLKINGTGNVVVTATPKNPMSQNGTVNVSAASCTIKVGADSSGGGNSGGNTTSKSSNANLSNLGIKPNDFSGFTPSKTSYSVTVENSVEEISVYATKQDSKASVSGTGKKSLKEGTNKFNIVVTAEDGTKKTYTISVIRKTANENTVPNVTDNPSDNPSETKEEKLRLTAIALPEDLNLVLNPTFNAEVFEYTLEVANEIESLELSGIPSINGSKVTITGNKELQEGENTITLTVTKEGMETVIYTIKVTRKTVEETAATVSVVNTFHSTIPKPFDVAAPIEKNSKIIVICACLIPLLGIAVCIREYAKTRKLAYADDYEEDDVSIYEPQPREEVPVTTIEPEVEKPQGRTIDLVSPEDWEDEPRRKRAKGKHF